MSFADIPADTDAERIVKALDVLGERQDAFAEAVNNLGSNVQWIVDNVQGIFQMFSSPAFMSMLPQMMAGMAAGDPTPVQDFTGTEENPDD